MSRQPRRGRDRGAGLKGIEPPLAGVRAPTPPPTHPAPARAGLGGNRSA